MLVGLYNLKDPNGFQLATHVRYADILKYNQIDYVQLDLNDPNFWNDISKVQFLIMRVQSQTDHIQMATDLIPIAENFLKIKCFPSSQTLNIYNDKVRQYLLFKLGRHPIIQSWIFWDKKSALNWIERASFPIVFKMRAGSASQSVSLVNSKASAVSIAHAIFGSGITFGEKISGAKYVSKGAKKSLHKLCGNFYRYLKGVDISPTWGLEKNCILFQKYLPNNSHDTRITIIGNKAFAFRRYNRANDFRASGSGQIDYSQSDIDLKCIEIAFNISKEYNFLSMAYDFIYNESGMPEFCEASYDFDSNAIRRCPGYWTNNCEFRNINICPEVAHLETLLGIEGLQYPND